MRERLKRVATNLAPASALIGIPDPDQRLAKTMREITEESGAFAPKILALLERRSAGCSVLEAAEFALKAWRAGGVEREQLIGRAMQSSVEATLIAELQAHVQLALKPMAGQPFTDSSARNVRKRLARTLRKRWPNVDPVKLASAISAATSLTETRLTIKIDDIVRVLSGLALAS